MRVKFSLLTLLMVFISSISLTHAADMWEKGQHYKELPFPVKTQDPAKIEVLEIFWYGCPHCYEFNNDHLPEWEEQFPEDVNFRLMPATFPGWKIHAQAYYAAEFLGVLDTLHQPLFDKIVTAPRKYKEVDDFKAIFLEKGVKEEDFDKLFKASGFRKISKIDEALKKAEESIKAFRITGVPALIINGKYKIGVRDAGSFENMIKVANFLISKEREAMKQK